VFHAFFHQPAAELTLQIGAAILILIPLVRAVLRSRPQTMNGQIDALARKTRKNGAWIP
jgi:hypothetical protein